MPDMKQMKTILFSMLLATAGCSTSTGFIRDDVLATRIGDISGNCYLLAIEVQRRMSEMGRDWYVVTLEKGTISHAAACGDGICIDNGLISSGHIQEANLATLGWAIVNIEKFAR
jgi:hypothetical protein